MHRREDHDIALFERPRCNNLVVRPECVADPHPRDDEEIGRQSDSPTQPNTCLQKSIRPVLLGRAIDDRLPTRPELHPREGVLIPAIPAFQALHDSIALEFVLDNAPGDLSMGDADVAVRLYRPAVPELVVKLIGSVQTAFFATQDYLDRCGTPATIDGLLEHDLIGFDSRGPLAGSYAAVDPRFTADRFSLRTDSLTGHLMAARTGAGIAALQVPIARRYPELIQLFDTSTTPALPFYLTAHEDARSGATVKAVWDWLDGVLRDYVVQ